METYALPNGLWLHGNDQKLEVSRNFSQVTRTLMIKQGHRDHISRTARGCFKPYTGISGEFSAVRHRHEAIGAVGPNVTKIMQNFWLIRFWLGLVWFYGIPTIVGYLMANPLHIYVINIYDLLTHIVDNILNKSEHTLFFNYCYLTLIILFNINNLFAQWHGYMYCYLTLFILFNIAHSFAHS